jgi:hypothetical protein
MDTRKFEYLESIRETIEQGDYEELKDYFEDIRESVKNDPDFQEIFLEASSGKFKDIIPLIDDIIYREMQAEFDELEEEEEEDSVSPGVSEFSLEFDFDEDLKEEISFEPFDEDGYFEKTEDEGY